MEFNTLLFEQEENIGILTINRPKALNALNSEVLDELIVAAEKIEKRDDIHVLIITGEGRSFVAGADISEMQSLNAAEGRAFGDKGLAAFRKLELLSIPVIAAVNGFALGGGCELSMAADMRIASEKAIFGQPEVGLGITPGFGGTQRLPRLIGQGRAMELILTTDQVDANEAYRLGLVNKVVAPEELMDEAKALANRILANGQLSVRYAKEAINRGIETDIETGQIIEKEVFGLSFATEDQKEGMAAFLEKRKADFKLK